ncbi:MAG: hypothetical protein NC204_05000 [Candidatus Amulumruptor caecigallinarius]|nr:hypothetical protein [Candidatus Amulumruptor caecigallinarius]
MNKFFKFVLTFCSVASGIFIARSQTAYIPLADVQVQHHADTLHITPAMIDSIKSHPRIESFERDIESSVFVPKGQWITGVSISYTQSNQNNYQFLVFEKIGGDTYSFKVSPMVAYAVRNDLALGVKFSYARNLTKLENASIVLDSETNTDIENLYSLAHNYYGMVFMRNYFSLGRSKRFGFFNEVQIELGGGQSKITRGRSEDLTGTYERNFSLDIGLMPGFVVFLNNYSAMEVNIGVLGFSYRHTKSIRDQIYNASRHAMSANFKINLFSITFGTTFYL